MFLELDGFQIKIVRTGAAFIHKIFAQIQIAPLTGSVIELHQCQLDLLVPGVATLLSTSAPEHLRDVIGVAAQRVEQGALSRGIIMRHRCFDQVTGAVQLVRVAQVRELPLRLHDGEIDIQIAIRLLCRSDQCDYLIQQGIEIWIGVHGKAVTGSLNPLRNIRIPEDVRLWLSAGLPIQPEGINASGLL